MELVKDNFPLLLCRTLCKPESLPVHRKLCEAVMVMCVQSYEAVRLCKKAYDSCTLLLAAQPLCTAQGNVASKPRMTT